MVWRPRKWGAFVVTPRVGATALFSLTVLLLSSISSAQPPDLPEGHPPVVSAQPPSPALPAPGLPEGHPPVAGSAAVPTPPIPGEGGTDPGGGLPAGHPPVLGDSLPGRAPSGALDDPSLPGGTVVVRVEGAVAGHSKAQVIIREPGGSLRSGPEGPVRDGAARFDRLAASPNLQYRVRVDYAGVFYESPTFRLGAKWGKRVQVQVFETTHDMDHALVGVQAFTMMEVRDDRLKVELLLRFANMGRKTWTPEVLTIALPLGYKGFQEVGEPSTIHMKESAQGAFTVEGFVPPGTTESVIQFHLPFEGRDTIQLAMGLPPRVAHLRILLPPLRGVRLDAAGLPTPELVQGGRGSPLLMSEKVLGVGDDQIEQLQLTIAGLPTPGWGRWLAVGLALLAVGLGGVAVARGDRTGKRRQGLDKEREDVLREIVMLEKAHRAGDVGPSTYARARQVLVDRLALTIVKDPGAPAE